MQFSQVGELRVLEVRHEHPGARVERVDHHLAVDRARDLDAAVGDLVGERRDAPVALAHLGRLRQEVRQLAGVQAAEPLCPPREQLLAAGAELALQRRQELDGRVGEDVGGVGHVVRVSRIHEGRAWPGPYAAALRSSSNCSSSVEPLSASVEAVPPVIVSRTSVEVAGADLALVARGGVALVLERELALLQPHVGGHRLVAVAAGELEHGEVERRGSRPA